MAKTLTAANSVLMLSVAGLFSAPQVIQGWASDDAFDIDSVARAQVLMGVDGRKSAGYTPVTKTLNLHLQADSPSIALFEQWVSTEDTNRETLQASGTISLVSVGTNYALTNGTLMNTMYIPANKKILQPRTFSIVWEAVTSAPV